MKRFAKIAMRKNSITLEILWFFDNFKGEWGVWGVIN